MPPEYVQTQEFLKITRKQIYIFFKKVLYLPDHYEKLFRRSYLSQIITIVVLIQYFPVISGKANVPQE